MTPEERKELSKVIAQLREPLAPSAHKIRPLPGGSKLYIYLPWQAVRDRLEEVVPDYNLSFSDLAYDHTANMVSIQATIEIFGIKKSAIAGVKISIISKEGNNAEIGHCIDRLHAEGVKNAGEAWCVGRYLDDQLGTYLRLWEAQSELDEETRGKLNQMKSQLYKELKKYETPQKTSTNKATPVPTKKVKEQPVTQTSSQALYPQHEVLVSQVIRLTGHTDGQVTDWCLNHGHSRPGDLPPQLVRELVDDLALGWGESKFQTPQLAETSYKGKISILTAGGSSLGDAVTDWIESVQQMPALAKK